MSTVSTPSPSAPSAWQWPADVLEFAAQRQVSAYLDPLLEATRRLYPTARLLRVRVEQDPELRDERWILIEVFAPAADVPSITPAVHAWNNEVFRICPMPLVHNFVLRLHREGP